MYFYPGEYVESYVNAITFGEETLFGQRSAICGDEMGIVYKHK